MIAAPINSSTTSSRKLANAKSIQVQRTPSQATSIKAEPGSNRAFSDISKKDICGNVSLVGEEESSSSCEILQIEEGSSDNTKSKSGNNSDDMDGSSFSSFYSSFIKTTDGSSDRPDNFGSGDDRPTIKVINDNNSRFENMKFILIS